MDVASGIHVPLSDDSQSPLSSAPPSPLLPPDGHPDELDSDMDYLDDELDSDTIEAL